MKFIEIDRKPQIQETVSERIKHFKEFKEPFNSSDANDQSMRCMDCGTPFCHSACPVNNQIPEWNELIQKNDYKNAWDRLSETNNFPEITGRICPAPCESVCTLGITKSAVSIRGIEHTISDKAIENGWLKPQVSKEKTGKKIAVVGSGPCGMAAAQQLARKGHSVEVFERNNTPGGLLTYGIPAFKLDKSLIINRVEQLREEGVEFRTGVEIGKDVKLETLSNDYDAVLLAAGANKARDLLIEDSDTNTDVLDADSFLKRQVELILNEESTNPYDVNGKKVLVIGGGDTGADCVGTSVRQGAKQVTQIEILPMPHPTQLRTSTSHEEGCERRWGLLAKKVKRANDGSMLGVEVVDLKWSTENGKSIFHEVSGSEATIDADVIIYAIGYDGFDMSLLSGHQHIDLHKNFISTNNNYRTKSENIFAAGDIRRGPSLVVHAIKEGRESAEQIHKYILMN